MKIYLSGKISGLPKHEYTRLFNLYEKRVYWQYADTERQVINPLNIRPLFGIKKWFFFMWSDIRELRKCSHIAMQPNWKDSKGAVIEYFYAKFILKLEVIEL